MPTEAATPATPEQNAIASYEQLVQSWNIPLTPDISVFIKRAVEQQWSSAMFLKQIRLTDVYQKTFPGILRNDGTPRMTEAQYIASFRSTKDYAATLGRNFSLQAYGTALNNGNSPGEMRAKIEALDVLKSDPQMFREFGEYLTTTGLAPKGVSRQDMLAFVMKAGPKVWEEAWQTAYSASQIEQAGITVGRGQDIGYKKLEGLIGHAPPGFDATKVDYAQLATFVQSALPVSKLYQAGITKKSLIKMAFGGPEAEPIRQRVLNVMATHQARFDPSAVPQLTQGGMSTGGLRNVQATE